MVYGLRVLGCYISWASVHGLLLLIMAACWCTPLVSYPQVPTASFLLHLALVFVFRCVQSKSSFSLCVRLCHVSLQQ
uniref:Uncharacterized protein n=1 Tax=Arundo donax TaxID=35708 RepID=A0A0A9ANM7_ARUDO